MPEPTAAPVAAPAAPSTPAPAAPSTPAPVAPATPAAPVSPTPATPETPSIPAPVTPAAPGKAEPQRANFPAGANGEKDYFRAQWDYQEEQAALAPVAEDVPLEAATDGEQTPEPLATEAADPDQPAVADATEALTPETVSALETKVPELKQFFEEHPEVKGAFYETARKLAKAQPIADMFPNLESAQFASQTANATVEIRTNFLRAAEDPTQIGSAFDRFVEEFREYDDKGQPRVDAHGEPVYGQDLELLLDHATTGRLDGSLQAAKDKIQAGNLSPQTAKAYETYVDALEYIKQFEATSEIDLDRPDPAEMTDEQRSHFERREAELKRREEEAGLRDRERNSKQQTEARQTHETKVNRTVGEEFGSRLSAMVKKDLDSGVKLPRYALESKDPTSGVPIFALNCMHKFYEKTVGRQVKGADGKVKFIGGDPKLRSDLARLEALPPGEESARQRVTFFNSLREQYLPEIYEAEKRRILDYERNDRQQRGTQAEAARAAVQPEPRGGTAARPQTMTVDAMYQKAEAEVVAESKGKFLSDRERQEAINRKVGKMML